MGVTGTPDIFQEKMSGLMATLEYVRAYINDLLIISKDSFEDPLDKLEAILARFQKKGLKVNATKSTFGVHKCEWVCSHPGRNKTSEKDLSLIHI